MDHTGSERQFHSSSVPCRPARAAWYQTRREMGTTTTTLNKVWDVQQELREKNRARSDKDLKWAWNFLMSQVLWREGNRPSLPRRYLHLTMYRQEKLWHGYTSMIFGYYGSLLCGGLPWNYNWHRKLRKMLYSLFYNNISATISTVLSKWDLTAQVPRILNPPGWRKARTEHRSTH